MSKQDQPDPALGAAHIDRMAHTVLKLAQHVWTLHDRQRVLEARLKNAGIDVDCDRAPDTETSQVLAEERDAFVGALLAELTGTTVSQDS